jgi:hypothetical protein
MVQRTFRDPAGLLRPQAAAEVRSWLDAFVAERREEGWPAGAVLSTFYAWARVRHWAARGVRRAAATTDLYTPFAARAYIEHALGLTGGERWTEQPHRRLVGMTPEIDVDPYEFAWQPDRPRQAFALIAIEGARRAAHRARARRAAAAPGAPHVGPAWLEAGTGLHREVVLSSPGSPLWEIIDRRRYEELVSGSPAVRAPHGHAVGRALAALWWFHGPGM